MGNRNKVQNPLTIIAIFAGLAELAGTGVLIGLPLEIQKVFVWFVMGFPIGLVLSFFLVLVFKHEVLYAPSDFADENHFVGLLRKRREINTELNEATALLEEVKKLAIPATDNSNETKIQELSDKLSVVMDKVKSAKLNNSMSELEGTITVRNKMSNNEKTILFAIEKAGKEGIGRKELSVITGLNLIFVTGILDSLIDKGLVVKFKDNYIFNAY